MRDKYINHIINISIMDKRKTKEKQKSEKTGNEKHKEKFNTVKQTEEQE